MQIWDPSNDPIVGSAGGELCKELSYIDGGARQSYILFQLILTDYQLLLFSCIISSYGHSHNISHLRY